jgi:hypothetical protein
VAARRAVIAASMPAGPAPMTITRFFSVASVTWYSGSTSWPSIGFMVQV